MNQKIKRMNRINISLQDISKKQSKNLKQACSGLSSLEKSDLAQNQHSTDFPKNNKKRTIPFRSI